MTTKVESNNWKISWQLLSLLLAVSFGGVGFFATKALLKLPDNASCNNISLWFTSATNRIYCAQLRAEKNTVEDLLSAINLLSELPENHPLNHEFNRYIKEWSNGILLLAQKDLDQGKLESAIATARQIPQNVENKEIIEAKISQWRTTWEKGQKIETQVEDELRQGQWNKAFLVAVKLLNIDSNYWRETRYLKMVNTIDLAREENKKLDAAYVSIKKKDLENLLETVNIASQISKDSYSYEEAQKLIADAEEELLKIATSLIDNRDWSDLSQLANGIPSNSSLNAQALDWNSLARAGRNVELGTVSGVELAISEAEQISSDSKIYAQAQTLIQDWEVQKEDLAYLTSARTLARSGDIDDLKAAIAKARLVQTGHTLYSEAQQEIGSWQRDIEIIEDTPIILQAKEFARNNTVQGWQSAINQASQVGYHRALYPEAKNLISQWRTNIETVEDRPILQRAIALGNTGRYQQAITTARSIGRGRALSGEAQNKIRQWQIEINAQENLDNAYSIAQSSDQQSLLRAINIARRIPRSSSVGFQSRQAIDLWSEQMLNIAQRKADTYAIADLEQAIRIAEMIPRGNSAYGRAQSLIQEWRKQVYPAVNPTDSSLQETNFYDN